MATTSFLYRRWEYVKRFLLSYLLLSSDSVQENDLNQGATRENQLRYKMVRNARWLVAS